jgi:hypothetical protein
MDEGTGVEPANLTFSPGPGGGTRRSSLERARPGLESLQLGASDARRAAVIEEKGAVAQFHDIADGQVFEAPR